MKIFLNLGLVLVSALASDICYSAASFKAPKMVASSFIVNEIKNDKNGPVEKSIKLEKEGDKYLISIVKSSLEKEFLLQASLVLQLKVPSFHGLRSRIVYFKQRNGKVYMLQANEGQTYVKDFQQSQVIAEYPIIRQTDEAITIDFSAGTQSLYLYGEIAAEGMVYGHDDNIYKVDTQFNYIEEANINEHNQLYIRQISQVDLTDVAIPVEMRYYLSPYEANPSYQKISFNPDSYSKVKFFEANALINENGTTQANAMRFDLSNGKKIRFAISANTPAEYKPGIRAGILYWNAVAGREIIEVVDAPAGITAPDINYNIIQWVKNDNAGYAYADMQADPKTGETLHAQVYLTSVFAVKSKERVMQLLSQMYAEEEPVKEGNPEDDAEEGDAGNHQLYTKETLIAGQNMSVNYTNMTKMIDIADLIKNSETSITDNAFNPFPNIDPNNWSLGLNNLFSKESQRKMRSLLSNAHKKNRVDAKSVGSQLVFNQMHDARVNLVTAEYLNELSTLPEAQLLEVSNNYLTEVVAHEVGHVLGLMHNFAGSMGSDYDIMNREKTMKEFLKNTKVDVNANYSSSVMDYNQWIESTLMGAQIKEGKVFDYDKKAFAVLYSGQDYKKAELPYYCDDIDAEKGLVGCDRFDYGNSHVKYVFKEEFEQIAQLPNKILNYYIGIKTPRKGDAPIAVEDARFPVERYAIELAWTRYLAYHAMTNNSKFLKIERKHNRIDRYNKKEVAKEEQALIANELADLGVAAICPRIQGILEMFYGLKVCDMKTVVQYMKDNTPEDKELTDADATAELSTLGLSLVYEVYGKELKDKLKQATQELLGEKSKSLKGISPNGQEYAFSTNEVEYLKKHTNEIYDELFKDLVERQVLVMNGYPIGSYSDLINIIYHPPSTGWGIIRKDLMKLLFEGKVKTRDGIATLGLARIYEHYFEQVTLAKDKKPEQVNLEGQEISKYSSTKFNLPKYSYTWRARLFAAVPYLTTESEYYALKEKRAVPLYTNFYNFLYDILPFVVNYMSYHVTTHLSYIPSKEIAEWYRDNVIIYFLLREQLPYLDSSRESVVRKRWTKKAEAKKEKEDGGESTDDGETPKDDNHSRSQRSVTESWIERNGLKVN
ncbi:MAG: zinc-dependent metalloprotease [Bacteriovoracaceae bacterium]|nr:zinc-dependent metalloprotease [Bacteriovoracaceae bacterium]